MQILIQNIHNKESITLTVFLATLILLSISAGGANESNAATITYQLNATVASVDNSSSGFPVSLAGLQVGDSITGEIAFDLNSPSAINPFSVSFLFTEATYYQLSADSFSANINGTLFSSWDSIYDDHISAYVWNDYGATNKDGFLFLNIPVINGLQFQLGNFILPGTTFSSESLPQNPIMNPVQFQMKINGSNSSLSPWFSSVGQLTLVPQPPAPVPEPATMLLFGTGLIGLAGARRKFKK